MQHRNDDLPPGMEDLGPSQELTPQHPRLVDASGQPLIKEKSGPSLVEPPLVWVKDDEATTNNKKPYYFPKMDVPGIATEFGATRDCKLFYPGERELFINLFAMHISKYLFGVECVDVVESENDITFQPNPKFAELPVYKVDSDNTNNN